MNIPRLALRSISNRRLTAVLTVASIALSVMLFLGVEKVRNGARESFANTISGTDLIMGSRTSGVQLLLSTIFRIGPPTASLRWESFEDISVRPEVAWMVPISLGESHRGYKVLGTAAEYFDRYRYRRTQTLEFAAGGAFDDLYDAVIGWSVAQERGYRLGDQVVIEHGIGQEAQPLHADKPFRVSGILGRTGTPVDRAVFVSMEAIEALHAGWIAGAPPPAGEEVSADAARGMDLAPGTFTAAMIGLNSRLGTFALQRFINDYPEEPLTAALPGVAFAELWGVVRSAERALLVVSALVVATALAGMVTTILSTLNERRREMAILRSVGARPLHVMGLLMAEAGSLAFVGVACGALGLYAFLALSRTIIENITGIYVVLNPPTSREIVTLGVIVAAGFLAGIIPAIRAYWLSLGDGLVIRV